MEKPSILLDPQKPKMAYRYSFGRRFSHVTIMGGPNGGSCGEIENLVRDRFDCQSPECEDRQKKMHPLIVI